MALLLPQHSDKRQRTSREAFVAYESTPADCSGVDEKWQPT